MAHTEFRNFRLSLNLSIVLVLLVICAGATVRATGSGMGCPDWPLCYDLLIPPVSVDQLPHDYATRYAVQGEPAHFDAVQTWIEYLNRLLGAVSGLAVLATLAYSFVYRRLGWKFPVLAATITLLMALVAWLGARVIDSNLAPYIVTLHLAAALSILALQLLLRSWLRTREGVTKETVGSAVRVLLWVTGVALALQVLLGIRVRELSEPGTTQGLLFWLGPGEADTFHRLSAGVLGSVAAVLVVMIWKIRHTAPRFWRWVLGLGVLIVLQAIWGQGLVFLGAAWIKPLHLLTATGVFCCWMMAVLTMTSKLPIFIKGPISDDHT